MQKDFKIRSNNHKTIKTILKLSWQDLSRSLNCYFGHFTIFFSYDELVRPGGTHFVFLVLHIILLTFLMSVLGSEATNNYAFLLTITQSPLRSCSDLLLSSEVRINYAFSHTKIIALGTKARNCAFEFKISNSKSSSEVHACTPDLERLELDSK